MKIKSIFLLSLAVVLLGTASYVEASHSWGGYHWARTTSSFNLKLGNNLSSTWTPILSTSSFDWSQSSVLETQIVPGLTNPRTCKPTLGRVEVCNSKYGNNGWLGIAQIWITNGTHITQAVTKLNDTYFNTPKYNTLAWRNLVTCQEIGHTFGLDHQDETFNNLNLGTCMDYTSDPASNQHPNQHDYDELVAIYNHLDTTNTVLNSVVTNKNGNEIGNSASDWGKAIGSDKNGKANLYRKDLGNGEEVYTHVFWTE